MLNTARLPSKTEMALAKVSKEKLLVAMPAKQESLSLTKTDSDGMSYMIKLTSLGEEILMDALALIEQGKGVLVASLQ